MIGLVEILVLGGGAIVTLIAVGGFFAWKMGNRLQQPSNPASVRSGNARFAALDRLFAEVRGKVEKDVDDPELTATLNRHLDDLQAKKEAAADRLEDLDEILRSSMSQEVRDTKLAEQKSLVDSVERIATGLRAMKERLTRAPNSADVTKDIAASLDALHGELDSQEKARREIAALEQKNQLR